MTNTSAHALSIEDLQDRLLTYLKDANRALRSASEARFFGDDDEHLSQINKAEVAAFAAQMCFEELRHLHGAGLIDITTLTEPNEGD